MTTDTDTLVALAKDRADWLLDAVACSTQDRRFLRGDAVYDGIAGESILLNGEKAITVALERSRARIEALEAEVARLRAVSDAFKALLAIVEGECPSLVNEDSGANQGLIDLLVRAEEAMETESK